MRRLVAALVVLSLASLASAGATHGTVVTGQATYAEGGDGAATYVIVQPEAAPYLERATNGSEPVARSLLELADDPPRVVKVNTTRPNGEYIVHLQSLGTYEVVAVTEDGAVSRFRTVTIDAPEATLDLELDPAHVRSVSGSDGVGTPGRTTTVTVGLENSDDEAVRNLSVTLEDLPANWTVTSVETDGRYDDRTGTLHWDSVDAGETARAEITVQIPSDAAMETYRIGLSADADDHFVEHTDAVRVRVSSANDSRTPSPTATPLGGDSVDVTMDTATPAAGGGMNRRVPLTSVVVFAAGVGMAAYAIGRTGLPFVGRRRG